MRRRSFLVGVLGSVVYVACGSDSDKQAGPGVAGTPDGGDAASPLGPPRATSAAEDSHKVFPQGVASGDPRPDRVVLWTRVEPTVAGVAADADVDLEFIIAKDEALTDIVARGTVKAVAASDHAVKVVPTELEPGRTYHYRFELAGAATTQVGRTKTAPDPSADVQVKFVMAACQDYIGRYWHAWQAFLEEKVDVDFVLFLGDYIYESVNDARFQSETPDRAIELPDGIDTSPKQDKTRIAAETLADYRALYKAYRKEPLLREVHRLFPFVVTWDDHEFADDCWQDHSTSFNGQDPNNPGKPLAGDEKNTARRTNANRAFSEHQPIDVPYKSNLSFPFDIQIYRTLRYGKHVELFLTDQRSYRDDHLVPEGEGASLAVGKFVNFTNVGSRYFIRKAGFDLREAETKPTLLGAAQKTWFVEAVKKSDATWKVWGNEVQVYQMNLDLYRLPGVPDKIFGFTPYTVYLNGDQWDGYRSERKEILSAFETAGVTNLLVCTGDIHSFYAAELHADFDAPKAKPIGVEYVTAGISSASLKDLIGKFIAPDSPLAFVVNAWTSSADTALVASNEAHLRFANTDSYGFALMSVDGTQAEATFVLVGNPKDKAYGGVKERHKFVTPVGTNTVKEV